MTSPAERHSALVRTIREHDHRYYVLDAPAVSDSEYDAVFRELRALEGAHPELVTPDSPTQRVGAAPREGFVKVEHAHRMFSLDNAYSFGDLEEFDRRVREGLRDGETVRYVAEPKIDGASLEVVYREGKLALAATRGDGLIGEDVTSNVRTIKSVPLTLDGSEPTTPEFTLRGEVLIMRADLDAVNAERTTKGEDPFMNPRNAAAGSLRLLDARETAARPLRVFFYDLVERAFATHSEMLSAIAAMGLPTHKREHVCESLDDVKKFIERFDAERRSLPYETDGVVIKVDDYAQRDRLGFTARFPRWAIAYKFAAERANTRVRSITAMLGRTGALTPVAELDPVLLSGTTVSNASLHNIDMIVAKDIRVGDLVTIEKAGEIIPQVIEVVAEDGHESRPRWEPPTTCPACGGEVRRAPGEAALRCINGACPGRLKAAFFHFTRRSAMDIDRIGESLIAQLVDRGLVRDLADIFTLPTRRTELLELDRMGEKSADKILATIEDARATRSLDKLIVGLGIPLVGAVAAKTIAERFATLASFVNADPEETRAALADIHGIGPKIAESVSAFLAQPEQKALLEKLLALGVRSAEKAERVVVEGPLTGSSFCVTGALREPRDRIHDKIRAAGGEVHDRVKKGTTYLVAGERVGASKLDGAKKFGTRVIDETALETLLSGAEASAPQSA
jgi:DNA ligase (NAD+)